MDTNEWELSVDVEPPLAPLPVEIAALAAQLRAGRCVLCAGPRLGEGGLGLRDVVAQLLGELPDDDAKQAWPLVESRPLAAAGFVRRRLGEGFAAALERAVAVEAEPSEAVRLLAALPFRAAITTAFDDQFERAFFADGATPLIYTPRSAGSLLKDGKLRFVWKALGDVRAVETLIWSSDDLRAALADPDYRAAAAELYRTRTFLFAGFDARDYDLQLLLEQLLCGAAENGEHYALIGGLGAVEKEDLWEAWRIRVLDGDDAAALGRSLHAALAVKPEVPADDDWESWLGRFADEPERAAERLDAIATELRERGDLEPLVELLLGRVGVEAEAHERAELLRNVARIFEHELDDGERAFTALVAALNEEPEAAAWHELERLTGAAGAWATLEDDLGDALPKLPPSVRVPLFRRLEKWAALAEALDERAAEADAEEARLLRVEAAALYAGRLGEPEEAIARYQALYAERPELAILLALEPLAEGTDAYLENLARQAELSSSDGDKAALYRRLAVMADRGALNGAEAEAWWETLLAVEPDAEDALRSLERLYRSARKWPELIEALRRRAARAPTAQQAELFLEIGRIYGGELNDRERAAEAWHTAEALAPASEPTHGDALAALCEVAEEAGAWEEARALYDRRALLCEGNDDELALQLRAAELCAERLGDLEGAAARLLRVLQLDDSHLAARVLAGVVEEKLQRHDGALAHFEVAMALEPGEPTATARAAELLWRAGRHAELVPILERLAQSGGRGPLLVERLVRLGHAASTVGDPEKSAQAFARASEMDPLHLPALRGHVTHLLAKESWTEARPLLERILEVGGGELSPGERLELLEEAARCELQLGSIARARALVNEALAIHPTHRPSLLMRVELESETPEALIAAKRALVPVASPDEQARLWGEIGDLYLARLDDGARALEAWDQALRLKPDDHKLLHKCLDLHVDARSWDDAREILERLIDAEEKPSIRGKYRLTVALICRDELGRGEAAAAHLRAALEDDPDNARATEAIERLYTSSEDWKELARHYRRQLKRLGAETGDGHNDERLRLWLALAELCASKLGEPEGAVAALEVALTLDPDDLDAEKQLADLYVRAGQPWFDRSIATHQRILRREKGRVHSYRALKHLYIQTQQRDKSLACSAALVLLHHNEPDDLSKVAEHKRRPFATARRPLGDDGWARIVHPDEDRLLDQVFALIGPTLAAGQAAPAKTLGVVPKDAVAEDDARSFAKALKYTCEILDVPRPQLHTRPAQREAIEFLNCLGAKHLEPVFLLGAPMVGERRNEMEQVFELARKLSLLVPERILRLAMPHPQQIAQVIEVAMALAEGDSDDAEVARLATGLKRALPPPVFDEAAAAGQKLRSDGVDPDAAARAWLVATDLTSLRVGWLLVGDLEVCARIVAAEGLKPGALPPTQRLLDLVWSTTTEELLSTRRQLSFA